VRIDSSPVYLDTSALTKIYVREPDSEELESALTGRRDLIVSDLAVTELTSALSRRVRQGDLSAGDRSKLYGLLIQDLSVGQYQRSELTQEAHRRAEELLMSLGTAAPLRAADALHLAQALMTKAGVLLTYDNRMARTARSLGVMDVIP